MSSRTTGTIAIIGLMLAIVPMQRIGAAEPAPPAGEPESFEGTGLGFYAVPDPLPAGEPGTLLRYEQIATYGGWFNYDDSPDAFALDTVGAAGGTVMVLRDPHALLPAPTGARTADPEVGRSVDELVSWLVGHPELAASEPVPLSVGGLDGFNLDVSIAAESTSSPSWCPPGEACVELFAPADLDHPAGFALFRHVDGARLILLETVAGDTVVIILDPHDNLGGQRDPFYTAARGILDSIEFGDEATAPDVPETECDGFGSCRGVLVPGRYASIEFQPGFSYTIAEATGPSAFRMMYLSESIAGEPIAVTGSVVVPDAQAPAEGRPILSVAHGTAGIADHCAPSLEALPFGLAEQAQFVDAGYLVAITDYEGLGTPGRHPYIVGRSEGRAVLDAAKAARQLPGADAGNRLAIAGHSQGGHAALWAAQLAAEWAPELDLVGTVAGGIPADLAAAGEAVAGPQTGYILLVVAGFLSAYPDIEASLLLTPSGEAELEIVDEMCAGDVLAHFAGRDPAELVLSLDTVEEWAALLEENNPGDVLVDAPILMIHGTDDFLPVDAVERLHERMCAIGQIAELQIIDGGDHDASWFAVQAQSFDWIEQRLAGAEPLSTCG